MPQLHLFPELRMCELHMQSPPLISAHPMGLGGFGLSTGGLYDEAAR